MTQITSVQAQEIPSRYVAFCDVLGFSYAIENHFDVTLEVYQEFRSSIRDWPFPEQVQVSVYSDSIIIVCEELAPLLYAVQQLWFAALNSDWLIRGGIAYGKHWECKEEGNLFVVSEALTRAAKIESTIRHPAIVISPEVELTLAHWVTRFAHDVFTTPLLHFRGLNIINPFNPFLFDSAQMRICRLMSDSPQHTEKYQWFLDLFDEVQQNQLLVPEPIVKELLELGIIQPIQPNQSLETP